MNSNALIAQGICLASLILLFGFVFKRYPLKKDIKSLIYASLFVLMSVILNALSLAIPFFGVPSVKIGFTYLPLMMSGFLLSPSWSFLVGFAMDMIGLMITPTDFPFLGFTLNHVIAACLPSILIQTSKKLDVKKVQFLIKGILALLSIVAIMYVCTLNEVNLNGSTYLVDTTLKLSITAYLVVACIVMIFLLNVVEKKMSVLEADDLAKWMIVVVVCELVVNMVLTPIWLDVMYGIPWFLSMFIRIVKACVMIPLQIFIGYSCIKILKRITK